MTPKTHAGLQAGLAVCLLLSACGGLPKRNHDGAVISLGHPRVVSRERFIADRNKELEWLRTQLDSSAYDAAQSQGSVLSRVVDSTSLSGKLKVDLVEALVGLDGDTQDNDSGEGGSGGDGDESQTDDSQLDTNEDETPKTGLELASDLLERGLAAEIGSPNPTPVDLLKDRLAFRDEVHSQIRLRALDDTHDRFGNTLHELTFDLSLIPGQDTGDPYVVVAEIVAPTSPVRDETETAVLGALAAHAVSVAQFRAKRLSDPVQSIGDLAWIARIEPWARADAMRESTSLALKNATTLHTITRETCGSQVFSTLLEHADKGKLAEALLASDERKKVLSLHEITSEEELLDAINNLAQLQCPPPPRSQDSSRSTVEDAFFSNQLIPDNRWTDDRGELRDYFADFEDQYQQLVLTSLIARMAGGDGSLLKLSQTDADDWMQLADTLETPLELFSLGPGSNTTSGLPIQPTTIRRATTPLGDLLADPDKWGAFLASTRELLQEDPPDDILRHSRNYFAALDAGRIAAAHSSGMLEFDEPRIGVISLSPDPRSSHLAAALVPRLKVATTSNCGFHRSLAAGLKASPARAIAISPTEQAEKYAVDLGSLISNSLTLELATSPLGTQAQASGSLNRLRQELLRVTQLERRPLVVGFIGAERGNASTFGWVLSPRLEARQGFRGVREYERQIGMHKPVTVTIVAPAQLDILTLKIKAYRISPSGAWIPASEALVPVTPDVNARPHLTSQSWKVDDDWQKVEIPLPIDGDAYARALMQGNDRSAASPLVLYAEPRTFTSGKTASILIRGENLWRSPEVYIGGQRAKTTPVTADLNGIHATFEPIALPAGEYDLTVVTSAGAAMGDTVHILPGVSTAALDSTKPLPVKGGKVTMSFTLTPAILGWDSFQLRLRDGAAVYHELKDVENARVYDGGRRLEITAKAAKASELGKPVDVQLYVVSDPDADPKRVTDSAMVTLVSDDWLTRKRTGKLGPDSPANATVKVDGKDRAVYAEGTKIVFEIGDTLPWSDICAAWGITVSNGVPTLDTSVLKDKATVELSSSGGATITLTTSKPSPENHIAIGASIGLTLKPGLDLSLECPPVKKP